MVNAGKPHRDQAFGMRERLTSVQRRGAGAVALRLSRQSSRSANQRIR
jgi:hypothetical protein